MCSKCGKRWELTIEDKWGSFKICKVCYESFIDEKQKEKYPRKWVFGGINVS